MRRLVQWLTASPVTALTGAFLCAILGYATFFAIWLPGALVVLLALRRSAPVPDWLAALVAGVTLAWLLLSVGAGPVPAALGAVALLVPPLLVGRLLARGGTLALAFQLSVLAALVMLGVVHLVLADPPGVWRPLVERLAGELDRFATMMSTAGSNWHPSREELRQAAEVIIGWGEVAWFLLLNTMTAACLGLYARGRETGEALLGPQFRALKAGRTLAVVALAMALVAIGLHSDFATDVSRLFLGAFVLQGLGLLHAAREMFGFGVGWLVTTYVLFFLPLAALLVQSALAAFGFLDNWLPLRARLSALAGRNKGASG